MISSASSVITIVTAVTTDKPFLYSSNSNDSLSFLRWGSKFYLDTRCNVRKGGGASAVAPTSGRSQLNSVILLSTF
jgi:hypothetical protein